MKKIYQTPNTKVFFVHTRQMITTSLGKNATGANADVVLGRQDNSWDIWGSGDDEE